MSSPSPSDLARSGTLEELYGKLDKVGMGPGWNKPTPSLWPAPRKTFVPAHWKYALARGALDAAGRLINTALAERRNLILFNPAEGNTYGTVRTLVAAYQMIMPGEWARVHRHTPNALRLILDAEPGTYTEVDGTNIAMAPGDVLVAAWTAPTYNSVMAIAGALIVQEGGLLCHAAVMARELDLPAVIGAGDVMDRINDCDVVEVDPVAGCIRVLTEAG